MGFVGILILFGTVFGGYIIGGGTFGVFLHPGEYIVILGAALAQMIIGTPPKYIKNVFTYGIKALAIKDKSKKEYLEAMSVLYELFNAQKKEGIQAIEGHIEDPKNSSIFSKYPAILADHHALDFICDSMRTFITGGPSPYDMDDLMTYDMEVVHQEEHILPEIIQNTADAYPAIGIVAAVLGVIVTMGSIAAGPEVVGMKVAGALVGTFLGIFVGYGFLGPIAKRLNAHFQADGQYFNCIKSSLLANFRGLPPQVAVEFGRRVIPISERPNFKETEEILKNAAAAGAKKAA